MYSEYVLAEANFLPCLLWPYLLPSNPHPHPHPNPHPHPHPHPKPLSTQAVYLPALEALHVQAHGPPSMMRMAAAQTRRTKRHVTDLTFLTTLLLYLACGVGGYLRAPGGRPAPN
jgi:hypothetical protein